MKKKVLLCLMLCTIISGITCGCGNKNDGNDSKQEMTSGTSIKSIDISTSVIVALTNSNELYVYGEDLFISGTSLTEAPKQIASNVEKFYRGTQTYYIDFNGDLYVTGLRYTGGVYKGFEKIASNIKDVSSEGFCAIMLDNDGNVLAIGSRYNNFNYCGFTSDYKEPTKVGSNAKEIFTSSSNNGYLTNSNELYVKDANSDEYIKTFEDVKKVSHTYILTNKGEVYLITLKGDFEKLDDNVSDINDTYYVKDNGEIYTIDNYKKVKVDVDVSSIDDILYRGYNSVVIYKNNDNKIVLHSDNGDSVIDYSLDNLKTIINYVSY